MRDLSKFGARELRFHRPVGNTQNQRSFLRRQTVDNMQLKGSTELWGELPNALDQLVSCFRGGAEFFRTGFESGNRSENVGPSSPCSLSSDK